MTELLIIKTANAEKLKSVLAKNHIEHQVIYSEPLTTKKPSSKKIKLQKQTQSKQPSQGSFSKLRQYIEKKVKKTFFLITARLWKIKN